jgi:pimeloyl-ACP methyl ester carboxylesterase
MSDAVVPFRVEISAAEVSALRLRLAQTRWPEREVVDDWSQGVPLGYMQELCAYWQDSYDMQRVADRLNRYPQFTTSIDGLEIHFLHVRSPHQDATPVVMTHGWPGSVVEFLKVIDALTDPAAHGGDASDAMHLVIPSLPGYGFSAKPTSPGWNIEKIADSWGVLMRRLGYERYIAQGGDWGAIVTTALGMRGHSDELLGIHVNMLIADPEKLMAFGELTEEEQADLDGMAQFRSEEFGYLIQQQTRPQTLGYGLADSPAAQCAWIVEKFMRWSDCDGDPETVFTRDELLDNVMVYWLNNVATSSARLYWESAGPAGADFRRIPAPAAYTVFAKENVRLSQRWAETRCDDLRYYNRLKHGGHFGAFERPDTFIDELRSAFRALLAESPAAVSA